MVAILFMRKSTYSSDEVTVGTMVKQVTERFPYMAPVSTLSIDDSDARMAFFNTKDYSGTIIDINSNGIVPRKPADGSIAPYTDGAYKSYDEILSFKI